MIVPVDFAVKMKDKERTELQIKMDEYLSKGNSITFITEPVKCEFKTKVWTNQNMSINPGEKKKETKKKKGEEK